MLDESDGPGILQNKYSDRFLLYFKRSFVSRQSGKFKGYRNYLHKVEKVVPMTYPMGEAYVKPRFNRIQERDYVRF